MLVYFVALNHEQFVWSDRVPDQDESLVETERLRSVFQQAPLVLLVTVINSILTAAVLAPVCSHNLLSLWVGLIVAVSVMRWAVRQRFLGRIRDGAQGRLWATLSVGGALTTGVLWGIAGASLYSVGETYQMFFAFVVGGMCAGTTAVNSAHMSTVLAFIVPATLPLAAKFAAEGSVHWLVLTLMILLFTSSLSLSSLRAHRAFGERVQLQLALSRQRRELSDANERLRREITERQKAEATLQQAQKIEAIGHLTGGIAHDFNNLLHVVAGNLSLIGRLVGSDPRVLGYVQAAEQAAKHGARLTNSLLAFARRQSLQTQLVSANTLLQDFQPILLRALGDTIRFQTILAPDLPRCNTDPAHFQAAILNLVINARDAMPEGGQLSISSGVTMLTAEDLLANPDAKPGCFVSITVTDSGSGMTDEILAQVFEPFFTTKEVGRGSGLGLSQVYGFTRQSHGHVDLRSTPGIGTCVTLYLPAADQ